MAELAHNGLSWEPGSIFQNCRYVCLLGGSQSCLCWVSALGRNVHRSFFPGEDMKAHLSVLTFLSRLSLSLRAAGDREGHPGQNMIQRAYETGETGVVEAWQMALMDQSSWMRQEGTEGLISWRRALKYLGPAEKAGSWDKSWFFSNFCSETTLSMSTPHWLPLSFLSALPAQECLHLCESSDCRCEGQRGVKRIWLQLSRISPAFSVKVSWRHRKLFTVPPVGLKSHCWEPNSYLGPFLTRTGGFSCGHRWWKVQSGEKTSNQAGGGGTTRGRQMLWHLVTERYQD